MIALAFIFGLGIGAIGATLSHQQTIQNLIDEIDELIKEINT